MSISRRRQLPSALALAAVALLTVGCSTTPASPAPTSTAGSPSSTGGADAGATPVERTADDVEAAWLDDGRMIAIVTWGSSSCRPHIEDVQADGQSVAVTVVDEKEQACTDDLAPRAVLAMLPEGIDVTKDVDLRVTFGDVEEDVDLDGLDAAPQGPSEQQPAAGWFDDDGIVLLTWGSSSCPPVASDLEMTDAGATVTFSADADRVCTMDFAPRATTITLPEERDDDALFTLTLVGDNLDGEVVVRG
jgi:hypothetical protein